MLARQAVNDMSDARQHLRLSPTMSRRSTRLRVIMLILGLPPEDEPRMLKLTQELFGNQDPDHHSRRGRPLRSHLASRAAALRSLHGLLGLFRPCHRRPPRQPARRRFSTVIANATVDREQISDFEAMSYYTIIAAAGHDTTSSSTAGALWALCDHPAEFAKLKANPSLIPGLVEEAIRWTTPVKHFMRSATQDTEVHGRRIAKGDWLMLCYLSGNRDEEVFDAPEEFRVDRDPNRHLGFGYGPHLCLGQHMAKMEMRILFEELLPRLDSIEFDGEAKLTASNFVSGPKTLPVKYRMR